MRRPVLIAYDGSDDARRAVRRAGELLPGRPALVVLVWRSLIEELLHRDVGSLRGSLREAAAQLTRDDRQAAEATSEEGAALAREAGLDAEALVFAAMPSVWDTLLEVADTRRAAVIVAGSRGLSGVRSALLGSVSMGLVNHSTRPVLVVPPPAGDSDGDLDGPVLIGFDGSQPSRRGAQVAGELFPGLPAEVVTVWTSLTDTALGGVVGAPAAYVPTTVVGEIDAETSLRADKTAEEGAALVAGGGPVESRVEHRRETVWGTLCELAAELKAVAVVVGSRGQSAVEAALLGSVSHGVVHHSRAPVLVVPPEIR